MPHFPGHELRFRRMVARASGQRPRLRRTPVKPRWPTGARVAYHKFLRELQQEVFEAVREMLFPQLKALVQEADAERGGLRTDASIDRVEQIIQGLGVAVTEIVEPRRVERGVTIIGGDVAKFNRQEFDRQMIAHFGVAPAVNDPFVAPAMRAFVKDNVALVKSVTSDELPKMERIVSSSLRAGRRVEEIQAELEKQFDISSSRAALIARDQVGKLNGELTELRQRNIGIEEYIWDTSKDERVRDSHADLDGKTFKWSDPPVVDDRTGRTAHPGQDYQCRCNAIPVIPEEVWEGLLEP